MFPLPNQYQVQETDKDLMELAARTKTSYQTLKNLNPYINSISQGQVINVPSGFGTTPNPMFATTPTNLNQGGVPSQFGPQPPPEIQRYRGPYVGQGTYLPAVPNVGAGQSLYQQSEKGGTPPKQSTPVYSGIQAAPTALLAALSAAKSPEDLPDVVSLADFRKTGLTLEQAFAFGYKLENGMLTQQPGGVAAQQPGGVLTSANSPGATPEQRYASNMAAQKELMESYRWDKKKKKYVKVKDLVRQGRLDLLTWREYNQPMKRNKHGRLVPANRSAQAQIETPPSPLETVRADTPSVTLDLILGS